MKQNEIVEWNINESKKGICKELKQDNLIIFFTRILEDLKIHKNPNFYGRIGEIYILLKPYEEIKTTKEMFKELKKKIEIKQGIALSEKELNGIKGFILSLDEDCKLKNKAYVGKLRIILEELNKKYLQNSNKILEPYVLGKLVSAVGGIGNISRMPASTIQLIGAEKALFRHKARGKLSPKYGLLYFSKEIQGAKDKGKAARQLANKLAISLKQDYFQNFAQ